MLPHKKLNTYIAIGVYAVALIVYLLTVAPTFSFWDCGEFIAVAYTMGVPHPPGTPIFTMLGRIFSMLPFPEDIGARVNLISPVAASFAVMFTYLITVLLIGMYRGKAPDEWSVPERISAYASGVIAALALAFSDSFWFNAVEAEVYASSMFFNTIVVWLMLKWHEHADEPDGDRWILYIAYAFGVALGVHLQALLAFFALALIYYFRRYEFSFAGFGILVIVSSAIFLVIYPGVVQKLPALMRDTSPVVGIIIALSVVGAAYYTYQQKMRLAHLASMSLLLILIGYSSMTMVLLRSQAKPPINENAPATMEKLFSYLNREQYGDYPIFQRRWSLDPEHQRNYQKYSSDTDFFLKYQAGHLYARYFGWQFIGRAGDVQDDGIDWSKFWGIPLAVGLFGLLFHARKDWKMAFSVFALLLLTGIFINIYTNPPEPQPRERDYVYVGSFFAFCIWIGIGIDALFETLRESVEDEKQWLYGAVGVAAFGLVFINARMLTVNFHSHSRAGNYVPYDYAYNLLQSCEKDAVLFTNGDNDTFPLWCLQEVYSVRQDVRVCNLSLANTDWYILQLKNESPRGAKPVKLNMTDREIKSLSYEPWTTRILSIPVPKEKLLQSEYKGYDEGKTVMIDGAPVLLSGKPKMVDTLRWSFEPTVSSGKQGYIRAQDRVVYEIIMNNLFQRPIYFAITVSESNRIGIDKYLRMDGFAYKVVPFEGDGYSTIDAEIMYDKLMNTFQYRNLNNPDVYLDENSRRLVSNYKNVFLRLASEYIQSPFSPVAVRNANGELETVLGKDLAVRVLDKAESALPTELHETDYRVLQGMIRIYAQAGAREKGLALIPKLEKQVDDMSLQNPKDVYGKFYLAQAYKAVDENQKALTVLQGLSALMPNDPTLKQEIADLQRVVGQPKDSAGPLKQ